MALPSGWGEAAAFRASSAPIIIFDVALGLRDPPLRSSWAAASRVGLSLLRIRADRKTQVEASCLVLNNSGFKARAEATGLRSSRNRIPGLKAACPLLSAAGRAHAGSLRFALEEGKIRSVGDYRS